MKEHTKCWDCQNARANKCSWFKNFTPVAGWEAEEKLYCYRYSERPPITYIVKNCPNFVADEVKAVCKDYTKGKLIDTLLKSLNNIKYGRKR